LIEIEHRIRIACTQDDVWSVLVDIPSWPEWTPTVTAARAVSGAGLGARFRLKQPLQREATWIVTHWQSGRSFAWELASSRWRFAARHELAAAGKQTVSLAVLRVEGPGALMSVIMRPVLATSVAAENRALKARCEARRAGLGPQ